MSGTVGSAADAKAGSTVVLLCLDSSTASQHALEFYATKVHRPGQHTVHAVTVVEQPEVAMGSGYVAAVLAENYALAVERATTEAKTLRRRIEQTSVRLGAPIVHYSLVMAARREEAIVSVANNGGADLIVTGCRGVGTLERTFLGSVSEYLLHNAARPVMVIRQPEEAEAS